MHRPVEFDSWQYVVRSMCEMEQMLFVTRERCTSTTYLCI